MPWSLWSCWLRKTSLTFQIPRFIEISYFQNLFYTCPQFLTFNAWTCQPLFSISSNPPSTRPLKVPWSGSTFQAILLSLNVFRSFLFVRKLISSFFRHTWRSLPSSRSNMRSLLVMRLLLFPLTEVQHLNPSLYWPRELSPWWSILLCPNINLR